ncbi:MAG TPA: serine/threonine-protein kinase, partial [Polyangiaceae bacterium]|nr:serine/threonine-protein kinase [Polyangiaceae bacterium]
MRGSLQVFADSLVLLACHYVERFDARRAGRGDAVKLYGRGLAEGALVAGRYRLKSMLGEGAMGQVWLARDELEQRDTAFKVMRAASASAPIGNRAADSRAAEIAFKHEFYTMTKLQHPNTVKVFDYGVLQDGDRFIAMEVVAGRDLSDLLTKGPLELSQIYRVLIDLANVLGFVHSRRFVHCDIKSSNVRMTETGSVRLMDFGMMHQLGLAAGGMLKGTPYYMAPEIPRGGVIDQRTDLYSLGVLAFELATGRYPFTGRSLAEI